MNNLEYLTCCPESQIVRHAPQAAYERLGREPKKTPNQQGSSVSKPKISGWLARSLIQPTYSSEGSRSMLLVLCRPGDETVIAPASSVSFFLKRGHVWT